MKHDEDTRRTKAPEKAKSGYAASRKRAGETAKGGHPGH